MARININVHKLFFTVNIIDQSLSHIVKTICSSLTTYSFNYNKHTKTTIKQKDKVFYSHIPHTNEYRFCINNIKDFMLILGSNGITRDNISVKYIRNDDVSSLGLKLNKNYKPRDYQEEYVKILTSPDSGTINLVDLKTGYGKGLVGMYAVTKLNLRTAILVLPKYIDKWISDVKQYTNIEDDDIYVVQGGDSLIELMEENDITYKFIILSMRTISNYITSYEENTFTYPVKPYDLMQYLNIGVLLNDESHQHFHALFKTTLYFDVKKFIGLSATLDTNQADVKAMYNTLFPPECRISNIAKINNYVNVKAITYKLEFIRGIQYKRQQGYNHNLYEQSIMKNNIFLKDYVEMIMWYIKECYISRRKPGDKLLVFMASINMCTLLTNHTKSLYKDLDVRRYVENDPYENIIEADITFSTILSAGTAIDIPNLISVLQTVSISSLQANLQSLGRLRKLPDKETWYYYLYTRDIKNQYKMHLDRREAIKHTVKNYVFDEYHKTIRLK